AGGVGPVQIATLGARAWILGLLLGDVFELGALLDGRDDGLGVGFLLHQDVAGLVFLAAVGCDELVVFGLDLGVGHGIVLLVVREQLADQDGLAGKLHLGLVVRGAFQAALLGFLHEDFTRDDLFLDLAFDVRRHRPAGAFHLLLE